MIAASNNGPGVWLLVNMGGSVFLRLLFTLTGERCRTLQKET